MKHLDCIGKSARESGFSLVEVVVSSALLAILVMVVSSLAIQGGDAQEYARRLNRSTEISQDLVDQIRLELVSSVRLFGNDAEGNGNLAAFDLAGAPVPLTGSVLPTVSPSGRIEADTLSRQITGNSMFFTRLAWTDRFICPTSSNEYLVDVYRWVYYYLTSEEGGPVADSAIGLNLVRIESEPLVDGVAIDRILDVTDQEEVLEHLAQGTADATGVARSPVQVVWNRGGDPTVAGTFRQIDDSDGSMSNTPSGGRPDPWEVLRRDSAVTGLLSYRHHSVATVFAPTFRVTRYGLESTAGTGFPHGFEIQVVGPSSARQVMLHLVIASTNRRGMIASANLQLVVDTRDL